MTAKASMTILGPSAGSESARDPERAARIVAGFGGSPEGFDALALGRWLADLVGAELIVAHVHPLPLRPGIEAPLAADAGDLDEAVQRHAAEVLDAAGTLLGPEGWMRRTVGAGSTAHGLHAVAEREEADLIVIGAGHRHGLGAAVGRTTEIRLVHGAPCAVAVAPAGWRADVPGDPPAIAAGYDGSPESRAALAAAAGLADRCGATARALGVFVAPNPAHPSFAVTTHGYGQIRRWLREAFEQRVDEAARGSAPDGGPEVEVEVMEGHPEQALVDASRRLDLLVVGSRAYGPLRTVLVGDVSARLAAEAACPLLIAPRGVERPFGAR